MPNVKQTISLLILITGFPMITGGYHLGHFDACNVFLTNLCLWCIITIQLIFTKIPFLYAYGYTQQRVILYRSGTSIVLLACCVILWTSYVVLPLFATGCDACTGGIWVFRWRISLSNRFKIVGDLSYTLFQWILQIYCPCIWIRWCPASFVQYSLRI